jgi:peroxiredoxin
MFKIQNIHDKSVIEIIAMNVDNENNVLIKEGGIVSIITISEFKDMVIGSNIGNPAIYRIVDK